MPDQPGQLGQASQGKRHPLQAHTRAHSNRHAAHSGGQQQLAADTPNVPKHGARYMQLSPLLEDLIFSFILVNVKIPKVLLYRYESRSCFRPGTRAIPRFHISVSYLSVVSAFILWLHTSVLLSSFMHEIHTWFQLEITRPLICISPWVVRFASSQQRPSLYQLHCYHYCVGPLADDLLGQASYLRT